MRINLARIFIALVILWNFQAAIMFLVWPDRLLLAYELQGAAGIAALRGIGLLFLMWNIPYMVAVWNPVKYRISLYEALVMQTIGLVGEAIIYFSLPEIHNLLRGSIMRFIVFDALGLVLLAIAAWITRDN